MLLMAFNSTTGLRVPWDQKDHTSSLAPLSYFIDISQCRMGQLSVVKLLDDASCCCLLCLACVFIKDNLQIEGLKHLGCLGIFINNNVVENISEDRRLCEPYQTHYKLSSLMERHICPYKWYSTVHRHSITPFAWDLIAFMHLTLILKLLVICAPENPNIPLFRNEGIAYIHQDPPLAVSGETKWDDKSCSCVFIQWMSPLCLLFSMSAQTDAVWPLVCSMEKPAMTYSCADVVEGRPHTTGDCPNTQNGER